MVKICNLVAEKNAKIGTQHLGWSKIQMSFIDITKYIRFMMSSTNTHFDGFG